MLSPMDSPLDARIVQGMRPLTRGELHKLLRKHGGDWKDGFPKNVDKAISPGGSKRQRMVNAADESEEEEAGSEGGTERQSPSRSPKRRPLRRINKPRSQIWEEWRQKVAHREEREEAESEKGVREGRGLEGSPIGSLSVREAEEEVELTSSTNPLSRMRQPEFGETSNSFGGPVTRIVQKEFATMRYIVEKELSQLEDDVE